ncbi:MAG: YihY/virulence factor BrkB family protein [Gammaproteobacteria bacterium]
MAPQATQGNQLKMMLNDITTRFNEVIWQKNLSSLPRWQSLGILLLRILQAVVRDLKEGLLTLRAMSLVYTTLLSLVPLLAVSFSVLKGFGVHNQIEPVLLSMLAPLGEKGTEITGIIIGFVDNIKVGVLGFLGLGLLIYTVISLIQKIERAFNFTWRITTYRSIAQRFSDYLSVIMVGPVLIFTAIGVTATVTHSEFMTSLVSIEPLGFAINAIGKLVPYILVIVAFTFIYVLIPNTKVQIKSALVGGIIAGILWETTGWLFASFVANSTNYTAVYSSFAILMVFMIWLYLSWLILLTGASIAFYHQHPERISNRLKDLRMSCRLREKTALMAMYLIAKSFHENKPAWDQERLAKTIDIATEALALVIDALVEADLITVSGKDGDRYIPSHSLENIRIKTILDTVRAAEESDFLKPEGIKSGKTVEQLIKNLDDSLERTLGDMSLRDLVTQQD